MISSRNLATILVGLVWVLLTLACASTEDFVQYQRNTRSKPPGCSLDMYPEGTSVDRPTEVLADVGYGESGFSVNCGAQTVISKIKVKACEVGADAVRLYNVRYPDGSSTCYRASAQLLRYTTGDAAFPPTGSGPETNEPHIASSGSGFHVDSAGHVLTNAHVVDDCENVVINTAQFRIHSLDEANDLAVLSGPAGDFSLPFREGHGVRIGETVTAIGFPLSGLLGSGIQASSGEVSSLSGIANDSRYLQITTPVNPGNSGGPILDSSGNVVGIVTSKLDAIENARRTGVLSENVNFALKASVARTFLEMNGVDYRTQQSTSKMETADVVEAVQGGVVLVECWQ